MNECSVHEVHRLAQAARGDFSFVLEGRRYTYQLAQGSFGGSNDYDALIHALGSSVTPSKAGKGRVLVTGGAGYIGSHACKALAQAGYEPVVYDNLSTGHRWAVRWGPLVEAELADTERLRRTLATYKVEAVLHFAASALVGESMRDPGLYFRNNLANSVSLLDAMAAEQVRNLVFSSSCATYGIPDSFPIREDHAQRPISPYGESKLAVERMLRWYGEILGLRSVVLRYFNAAGADPDGELGEEHDPETHLIPLAIRAAAGDLAALRIYGTDYPTLDGTAVRDYVHVADLAQAHRKALDYLVGGGDSVALNLGTGEGFSVRQIVDCLERITGQPIAVENAQRRPGDPPVLVADASRARQVLGWTPRFTDPSGIVETAWRWRAKHRGPAMTRGTVGRVETNGRAGRHPKRVAVIGAGPAGLTAAYQLAKANVEVDVYEAAPSVGGLSKTIALWGQRVDLGPHRFFSSDARVNRLWLELVGRDYQMVDRLTRIFYKNRFFQYPLRPMDALAKLGVIESARCVLSYGKQCATPKEQDGSFEDWVVSAFGRRLFEIFFRTYSEKLWGIRCKDLDADFAAQRIKKLSLYEALKNAFRLGGGSKHKTLVDRFAFPNEGTGVVYERMAAYLRNGGNNVFLSTPVQRVVTQANRVTGLELTDGTFQPYDEVISTMPLNLMVQRLPEVPRTISEAAASLRFRNTILVYLHVDGTDLFPDNWLYVHSADLRMGRVTNFRNWTPTLYGDQKSTILALEYWCYEDEEMWGLEDRHLIGMATEEIRRTGLIGDALVMDGHVHRIHRCYPVYSRGYKQGLRPVEEYLSGIQGLRVIGRYGAFKYNNQDHSILMGILAAENILQGDAHDLWGVNTDYESYQESGIITEEGLVTA